MKNTELQIMIHGTGLGMYDVQLSNSQGIELKSVNKFDNKNYIILYVDTKGAPAQTFSIDLVNGKGKTVKMRLTDAKGKEVLSQSVTALDNGPITFDYQAGELANIKAWSAEIPNLYTLYVSLYDGDKLLECIPQRSGFSSMDSPSSSRV